MPRTICQNCGRVKHIAGTAEDKGTKGSDGLSRTKDSHSLCVRCYMADPGTDTSTSEGRQDIKDLIKDDTREKITWEGPYTIPRPAEENKLFEELMAEVQCEMGEGVDGQKR